MVWCTGDDCFKAREAIVTRLAAVDTGDEAGAAAGIIPWESDTGTTAKMWITISQVLNPLGMVSFEGRRGLDTTPGVVGYLVSNHLITLVRKEAHVVLQLWEERREGEENVVSNHWIWSHHRHSGSAHLPHFWRVLKKKKVFFSFFLGTRNRVS